MTEAATTPRRPNPNEKRAVTDAAAQAIIDQETAEREKKKPSACGPCAWHRLSLPQVRWRLIAMRLSADQSLQLLFFSNAELVELNQLACDHLGIQLVEISGSADFIVDFLEKLEIFGGEGNVHWFCHAGNVAHSS